MADLALHGVPAGRKPDSAATINAVAATLSRLSADDVEAQPLVPPEHPSQASFRTFEGLQIDLQGYKDGTRTWVRIGASFDPATARRFAASNAPASAAPDADAQATTLNARLHGFEFELPGYKYDAIFRPLEELLAPRTGGALKAEPKVKQ